MFCRLRISDKQLDVLLNYQDVLNVFQCSRYCLFIFIGISRFVYIYNILIDVLIEPHAMLMLNSWMTTLRTGDHQDFSILHATHICSSKLTRLPVLGGK